MALSELEIAEFIARRAHAGQTEESTGDDYIRHIERVVALVDGEQAKAAAWLHDVLEDSEMVSSDLRAHGISQRVVDAVLILTRLPWDTYEVYIQKIKFSRDRVALAVKIADLRDHFRPNCPERLRPRYFAAWAVLNGNIKPPDCF
jgi:(p)ppGpp synthase/HD superfamily hydrolase